MSTVAGLALLFALCLVLSVFFSALHTAYGLVKRGGAPDAAPAPVPDDLLNSLVLGNLAANIGAASSATLALRLLHGGEPGALAWVVLVLSLTLVLLIPCEMIPQSVGAIDPAATVRRWGGWLRPWLWLARPFAAVLTRLSAVVRGLVSGGLRAARLTPEDVRTAVEGTSEHLELESEERDMVHSIFSFGETIVREVMVPRPDMVAVEEGVSFGELMEIAREAEHSRLPVYRETLDNVVGIVYVKDLLARRYGLDGRTGLEGLLREASYVPESKKIDELLREFQTHRRQMAIVVDEYGGTAGLVTIEDILEEIVGEIQDEHDREEPLYALEPGGAILVDARMELDDFGEVAGAKLHGEGFETVGGLVYTLLGRVPVEGEEVTAGGLAFRVAGVEGRRIQKLRVTKLAAEARPAPGLLERKREREEQA
jgi:putative hemolysin